MVKGKEYLHINTNYHIKLMSDEIAINWFNEGHYAGFEVIGLYSYIPFEKGYINGKMRRIDIEKFYVEKTPVSQVLYAKI